MYSHRLQLCHLITAHSLCVGNVVRVLNKPAADILNVAATDKVGVF